MRPEKRNYNFKLRVTLPNNAEAGKRVSIDYDLSGQNKLMRDEGLRKAEHLSNTNVFASLHILLRIGEQRTYYMLGSYVT